jgi:ribonuclease HI
MVHKWALSIEVSCYPKHGEAVITYVLHNKALNHVLQSQREVYGRTTNNEAYYIALVEGMKTTKKNGANDIVVFTNSELICNQMKGIYQVRKDNLKLLHREARIVAPQFHSFTINYHVDRKRMSNDLVSGGVSTIGGGVKNDLVSTSTPTKVIHGHRYRSPMCGFFLVMIVVVSFMGWLVH